MDLVKNNVMEMSSMAAAEEYWRREIRLLQGLSEGKRDRSFAIAELADLIDYLKGSGDIAGALGLLATALEYGDACSPEDYWRLRVIEAEVQLVAGNFHDAELGFRSVVGDSMAAPAERLTAQLGLAETLASAGNNSAAVESLSTEISLRQGKDSQNARHIMVALATHHNMWGKFSIALEIIDDICKEQDLLEQCTVDFSIQKAWALTHSGRFHESDAVLNELSIHGEGLPNAALLIRAWNKVGNTGENFGTAIKSVAEDLCPEQSKTAWEADYFRAWSSFGRGSYEEALRQFQALSSAGIVLSLTSTAYELKLLGEATCQLEQNNRAEACTIFEQLAHSSHSQTMRVHFPKIISGLLHASLHGLRSGSALRATSLTRRRAQVSLGNESVVAARVMDLEAALILVDGQPNFARTVRVAALKIVRQGGPYHREELSHLFGICLIELYEGNDKLALDRLIAIYAQLDQVYGGEHALTVETGLIIFLLNKLDELESSRDLHDELKPLLHGLSNIDLASLIPLQRLGHRQFELGNFKNAMTVYRFLDLIIPDSTGYIATRAEIDVRIGECHRALLFYREAAAAFESALKRIITFEANHNHFEFEIRISWNECMVQCGSNEAPLKFFSSTAAELRLKRLESTPEYFRVIRGYAECLENLGLYAEAAHNYEHLVGLAESSSTSFFTKKPEDIYLAAAWNNEQAGNFTFAASLYQKAYTVLEKKSDIEVRRLFDLMHRRDICNISAQV